VGRDRIVGIENCYGVELSGDRKLVGPNFPYPTCLLFNGYWVFVRVKRPGRGVDHPFPSSAEVKGRVLLCGGHMAFYRLNFAENIWAMNI
jgi:hypothetical protein